MPTLSVKDELQPYIDQTENMKSGEVVKRPNVRIPKELVQRVILALPVGMFEHPDLAPLKKFVKTAPGDDCVIPRSFLETLKTRM